MPTLLSRFDLIYLVLDQPNEAKDRKLAKHLVGLYHEVPDRAALEVIPMDLLTAYISHARRTCRPTLSSEAEEKLIEFYTAMRQQGGNQKVITATPRQLEALIRLSEALAKMSLASVVTEEHVFEAKRLMDVATQRVSTHNKNKRTRAHMYASVDKAAACVCSTLFLTLFFLSSPFFFLFFFSCYRLLLILRLVASTWICCRLATRPPTASRSTSSPTRSETSSRTTRRQTTNKTAHAQALAEHVQGI
jgi:hypothetical protein